RRRCRPREFPASPYTTLFRSRGGEAVGGQADECQDLARSPARGRLVVAACRAEVGRDGDVLEDRELAERPRDLERPRDPPMADRDRKSTRLNSSHVSISYAVF